MAKLPNDPSSTPFDPTNPSGLWLPGSAQRPLSAGGGDGTDTGGERSEADLIADGFGVEIPAISDEELGAAIVELPLTRSVSGLLDWVGTERAVEDGMPADRDSEGFFRALDVSIEPLWESGVEAAGWLPAALWSAAVEAGLIVLDADTCRRSDIPWPPTGVDRAGIGLFVAERAVTASFALPRRLGEELDAADQEFEALLGGAMSALLLMACRPDGVEPEFLVDSSELSGEARDEFATAIYGLFTDLVGYGILQRGTSGWFVPPALLPVVAGPCIALDLPVTYQDGQEPAPQVALARRPEAEQRLALRELPLLRALAGVRTWVGEGRALRDGLPREADLADYCEALGVEVPGIEDDLIGLLPVALWVTASNLDLIHFDAERATPGERTVPTEASEREDFARAAITALLEDILEFLTPEEEGAESGMEDIYEFQTGAFMALVPLACRPGGTVLDALLVGAHSEPEELEPAIVVVSDAVESLVAVGILDEDDGYVAVPPALQPALREYLSDIGMKVIS